MTRKNILITLAIVLIGAGVVAANLYYRRDKGLTVTTDVIKTRDLEAVVSASGKIQPKRLVNISADTPGRVVDLAVNEGDRIKKGQFLLQIDPRSLRTRVDSGAASMQAAQMSLDQMRQAVETARVQLEQAQQTLKRQQDLWAKQLTTREALEKATNDVKAAESALQEREHARRRAGQPHQAGARRSRERPVRSQQSPHRIADRRHRHAPQHSGRRNGRHRHDEQRRNGPADARRHVGDPGGGRSGRNQHSKRSVRTEGEDFDRCHPRPDVQGTRHGNREQPDPGERQRRATPRRRRTSRSWSCSTKRCPTSGRDSRPRPTS